MPLTLPSFDQYQQPLFPLRGLWHHRPDEGDRYLNVEIQWLVTTRVTAVQFSLSGNSPVSLSQIVALAVDNSRCGVDVDFIFPDSGFILTVPAHNQLIAPVFTNALMFYASAPNAQIGDVSVIQILNSMPPPIPIEPSSAQNIAIAAAANLGAANVVQLVPAITSGMMNAFQIVTAVTTAGSTTFYFIDGNGLVIWEGQFPTYAVGAVPITMTDMAVRFARGLQFVVTNVVGLVGIANVNVYYRTP